MKSWPIRASMLAALALTLTYLAYRTQLERHMHDYFPWFMLAWVSLACLSPFFAASRTATTTGLLVFATVSGYLTCTAAYWVAVAIKPLGRVHNLPPLSFDLIFVVLGAPFVGLGGWIFTAIFATLLWGQRRLDSLGLGSS